jgi:hypothetical protein
MLISKSGVRWALTSASGSGAPAIVLMALNLTERQCNGVLLASIAQAKFRRPRRKSLDISCFRLLFSSFI